MALGAQATGQVLSFLAGWLAEGRVRGSPEIVKEVLRHLVFADTEAGVSKSQLESSFIGILQRNSQASPNEYSSRSGQCFNEWPYMVNAAVSKIQIGMPDPLASS